MAKIHYYDVGAVEQMLEGGQVPEPCRAEKAAVVQTLTARGMDVESIAQFVRVREREVFRLRAVRVEPWPEGAEFDASEERAKALENMTLVAMNVACEMRNDPVAVWDLLGKMEPQPLIELTMALACMVPVDSTVTELLGWVDQDVPESRMMMTG